MKPYRFIHIPKTGGTSILKVLTENSVNFYYGNEPKRVGRHRYASAWKDEQSIKFTIVRDPYTRTVSYYNYIKRSGWNPTFEDFVKNKMSNNEIKVPNAWVPQTKWIYQNNECLIDNIFKLEDNLEQQINSFLNINCSLTKENVSTYDNYMQYYNQDLLDLVTEYFSDDFKLLGYKTK